MLPIHDIKETVSETMKNERLRELMNIQREISQEVNDKYIGQVLPVLLDGTVVEDNLLNGRTNNNKPIFVEGNACKGGFVRVKITETKPFSLKGVLAQDVRKGL